MKLSTRTKGLSFGFAVAAMVATGTSCTVVNQGEIGVKRTLGNYSGETTSSGIRWFFPFVSTIVTVPIRTINTEVQADLPSREGLTIRATLSILYSIREASVPDLLRTVGTDFASTLVMPVFRSAVADVSARFYAKDMHSGSRAAIEAEIRTTMMATLEKRGVIVEAVLLKSIILPDSLSAAIESKLSAEQAAQQMQFELQRESQEAERMRVKAKGISDYNEILGKSLNSTILQFKKIEAWVQLAASPNAKVIITPDNSNLGYDTQTGNVVTLPLQATVQSAPAAQPAPVGEKKPTGPRR